MAQLQQHLLDSALQHVKRLGWTRSSLDAAAAELQLSPAVVGMFPRGPSQLVEHFIAQQNAELDRELQAAQQQYLDLPLRQRITAAVRRRLELNVQHIDSWPQVSGGAQADCRPWLGPPAAVQKEQGTPTAQVVNRHASSAMG